jgi:hypothetical protein
MFRHVFALIALLVFSTSHTDAQTSPINRIQILETGIYRSETIKRTDTPGTTGLINTVQNPQLINSTTTVPGLVGVRFGLRYVPLGGPAGSNAPLMLVITFPSAGLRNPDTRQLLFRSEHMVTVPIGASLYWEYHFENEWEIVSGLWSFEFWHQGTKLTEQRFCVYALRGQSPTVRAVPRECAEGLLGSLHSPDRPAIFAAQVAGSQPCWLVQDPLNDWLTGIPKQQTTLVMPEIKHQDDEPCGKLRPSG